MTKRNEKDWVNLKTAMCKTGLSKSMLHSLVKSGEIKCYRTCSYGHRRYSSESIDSYVNSRIVVQTTSKEPCYGAKKNFIYTRVSSKKQEDDLARQVKCLKDEWNIKCADMSYELLSDVSSGVNFKRKGLETILDACFQQVIGTVMVAHKDRLSRWGFDLIKLVIEKNGGKLVVIDDENNGKSTEQELAEDLLSIVHIYPCRNMGRRKYTKRHASQNFETTG